MERSNERSEATQASISGERDRKGKMLALLEMVARQSLVSPRARSSAEPPPRNQQREFQLRRIYILTILGTGMANSTQQDIQAKVGKLETHIRRVNIVAWFLVWFGVAVVLSGLVKLLIGDTTTAADAATTAKFSWSALAALGSYFQGTVASIWALAGLLFIYIAFLGQKQQVLQQDSELLDQKRQFQLQHDSIRLQNFENAFFQLLALHNEIVNAMRDADLDKRLSDYDRKPDALGRDCFARWYDEFKSKPWGGTGGIPRPKSVEEKFAHFYNEYQGNLGHYFRNLYHLIKFVNESDALKDIDASVEYKNRRRYTSLVRAQLSAYELALLFYDGLSTWGKQFKPLIEEFGLLENLDHSLLLPGTDPAAYEKAFK